MTPLLEWQQIPSQRQSVLFLGQHYEQTMEKLFRDKVCFVWDNTINRLRKNDSVTKCAMFGTTLSMDYGKMFQRQSVLYLGQRYEQSTKK